ncbi:hypothetical protein Pst134EA_017417 [Puccinia striiformis f. sp. tritici]|uniref:hypothetical protein n=1 Tax=Puccinia striiformis f. sp. tritici TaxID=168172 RepID=UPI0020073B4F|nr:hypothetical protein Pst134EA_017417 [Puccinia striiformis f. sp. tritici]KAH9461107.1 hypothetical protein Pst134EA_017417 [Puccinia striiformis f. sp. tritici]
MVFRIFMSLSNTAIGTLLSFTILYIVPGTKIFIKTHGLYVVGRKIEITGNLVDFDMDNFTAVVSVNSVAVTTGHQIGRVHGPATASPSGSKNGRKLCPNVNSNQPQVDPRKDAFTNTSSDVEMSPADCSPSDPKGKRKAATMEQVVESDSYDSDAPIVNSAACSSTKTRPCPNILQEAAKRLKQM